MADAEHELRLEKWRAEYLEHLIEFFGHPLNHPG
jgi:hypothetical protein